MLFTIKAILVALLLPAVANHSNGPESCGCRSDYEKPVCARGIQDYANICWARCDGVVDGEWSFGRCDSTTASFEHTAHLQLGSQSSDDHTVRLAPRAQL